MTTRRPRPRLAILMVATAAIAIAAACSDDSARELAPTAAPTSAPTTTTTAAPTGAPTPDSAPTDTPDPDRAALVTLYEATGAANWLNSDNWLSEAPLDEWHGVTIDDSGRVIELNLSENELSGEIPPELGNLTNLQGLYLSGNQLSGEIPPELGNLSELVGLHLQENQLSGEIPPELGNLPDLVWLFLSGNQLSGCNPTLPDNTLVIVSSPSAGDEVESGFVVSGCSRTFESNVQWRLLGRSGAVLSSGSTSGGGVYGPAAFQFSVEFEDVERQIALLEVFEEDVSEGQGFPPPRAVVPIIIGLYQ